MSIRFNKQSAITFGIALLGLALDYYAYFPGLLSPDSIDQYEQALTNHYTDWHPPLMAAFWSLLIRIYPGGALMFLVQVFIYWLSFVLLMRAALKHFPKIAFTLPLFYFAPFMQNFVGNIWKDVGLAISWLMATAIILNAFYGNRKLNTVEALLSLILLSYGCWIRINALPGVIPLLSLWLLALNNNYHHYNFKKLVLRTFYLISLVLAVQLSFTYIVLKPKKIYPEYKLFMHDLTGIYKETGIQYFPDFIASYPGFDSLYLKEKYIHSTFDNIWWNNDGKQVFPESGPKKSSVNSEQIAELRNCWIKAILKHPLVYLKNRGRGLLDFLRITESGSQLTITYLYIHPNDFGLEYTRNRIAINMRSGIERQRPMPYMKPWFWFFLNLLLIVIAYRPRFRSVKQVVLCLSYSSLFYFLLEFIVFQADTEFRYFYWNCAVLTLALVVLWSNRYITKTHTMDN